MVEKKVDALQQICIRFGYNLARVESLITIYDRISGNKKFEDVKSSDILRSGVVFLHATLEDVFRQLIRFRADKDISIVLKHLKFPVEDENGQPPNQIKLSDLISYRDKPVDEVIQASMDYYFEHLTFSRRKNIDQAMVMVGLSPGDFTTNLELLIEAVKRRHKIVHEGDRKPQSSDSHGQIKKIVRDDLAKWLKEVENIGKAALLKMGADESWISDEE